MAFFFHCETWRSPSGCSKSFVPLNLIDSLESQFLSGLGKMGQTLSSQRKKYSTFSKQEAPKRCLCFLYGKMGGRFLLIALWVESLDLRLISVFYFLVIFLLVAIHSASHGTGLHIENLFPVYHVPCPCSSSFIPSV